MAEHSWTTGKKRRKREEITPSSHTYPVAVGDSSAATLTLWEEEKRFHGSLLHRRRQRCPGVIVYPRQSHITGSLVVFNTHSPETPQVFCVYQDAIPGMMQISAWGGCSGHLLQPFESNVCADANLR